MDRRRGILRGGLMLAGLGLLAGCGALPRAWQPASRGSNTARIGHLSIGAPGSQAAWFAALHDGLLQAGYVEGQNLVIEYRWAEGRTERLAGPRRRAGPTAG